MKIVSLTCPKCGGNLEEVKIADGKNETYCSFCGNHIFLENENYKVFEHRTVDAVKMRELEYRLKREEEEYQRNREKEEALAKRQEKRWKEDLEKAERRMKLNKKLFFIFLFIAFISSFFYSISEESIGLFELIKGISIYIFVFSGLFWAFYRNRFNSLR